ncbi:major facilitator superfamily domain-containing protein [Abortiporus biennis]|nr:major facilitator superfamily domain-containing protein [Abortiporus biennis]
MDSQDMTFRGNSGDVELLNLPNILTRTSAGNGSRSHNPAEAITPTEAKSSQEIAVSSMEAAGNTGQNINIQELPPLDRGWRAWSFCFAAFIVEALVWGFSYSYGVFQNYYSTHPPFRHASPVGLAAVGTTALATEYALGVVVAIFHNRYPDCLKKTMWSGLALTSLSLALSSFVSQVRIKELYIFFASLKFPAQVPLLILFQGVGIGIGGGLLYWPIISLVSDWFVERRGLAGGIIFAGSGAGGFLFPLIANALLDRIGFRWTMRVLAALVSILGGAALFFVQPRIPLPKFGSGQRRPPFIPSKIQFLGRPVFWAYSVTNLLQAMSFFPVSLYIAVFTASISSALSATIVLSLFNIAGVVGQILIGWLSDRFPYPWIMFSIAAISSISAFLLWGFAETLIQVFIFSALFGGLSGGFPALGFSVAVDSAGSNPEQASMAFTAFTFIKGAAAVIGPIVSGILLEAGHSNTLGMVGSATYGKSGFGPVEIFVGSCAAATSISSLVVAATRPRVRS